MASRDAFFLILNLAVLNPLQTLDRKPQFVKASCRQPWRELIDCKTSMIKGEDPLRGLLFY